MFASESERLRRRAKYFFGAKSRRRGEVAEFASILTDYGPIAVVGGMLRELLLGGNRSFSSDVDFVVMPASTIQFEQCMEKMRATRNRFGGYGLTLSRWKVDVWPLQKTWAAEAGHVSVQDFSDVVRTTFFNWDAILYLLHDHAVIASTDYFDALARRYLEINLEPNPNPIGNAVRALRYAWRWHASFGPRLAQHVHCQIQEHGWQKLVSAEHKSFRHRILPSIDEGRVMSILSEADRIAWQHEVKLSPAPVQTRLPLG